CGHGLSVHCLPHLSAPSTWVRDDPLPKRLYGKRSWPERLGTLLGHYMRPRASRRPDSLRRHLRFRMCAATTCAIVTSADSRAHPYGASLRASWCWLPQTNGECRAPTDRQPSPKRRVVQPALLRRTSATQMTEGATLQLCL